MHVEKLGSIWSAEHTFKRRAESVSSLYADEASLHSTNSKHLLSISLLRPEVSFPCDDIEGPRLGVSWLVS